jgi:hypothetical protein
MGHTRKELRAGRKTEAGGEAFGGRSGSAPVSTRRGATSRSFRTSLWLRTVAVVKLS